MHEWGKLEDRIRELESEIARLKSSQRVSACGTANSDLIAQTSAAVAHDLRNVFTAISINLSVIDTIRESAGLVDEIELALHEATGILDRFDAIRNGQVVEAQPVCLNQRVNQLLPMLAELCGPNIDLMTELSHNVPDFSGDPTQIDQVLLNLVKNAGDSISNRGDVIIRTRCDSEASTPSRPGSTRVILTVTDTGCGIPTHVKPRIFDPNVITKHEGRGLGLATVKGIIESHHGDIAVVTSPEGTTFEIAFPAGEINRGTTPTDALQCYRATN